MGGNMLPLHIRDVRDEATMASDPDALVERVMLIDDVMLSAHFERQRQSVLKWRGSSHLPHRADVHASVHGPAKV